MGNQFGAEPVRLTLVSDFYRTPPPPFELPMATFGAVRGTPLDQSKVDSYLSLHIPSFQPPSHIQQFSFGQSFVPSPPPPSPG